MEDTICREYGHYFSPASVETPAECDFFIGDGWHAGCKPEYQVFVKAGAKSAKAGGDL